MTDEPWDFESNVIVHPPMVVKTPPQLAEHLHAAPLANLKSSAVSEEAMALIEHLDTLAPRLAGAPAGVRGAYKPNGRLKVKREATMGALLADLLLAQMQQGNDGWTRMSLNRADYKSPAPVSYRMMMGVRTAWKATGLLEEHAGYPGSLGFGNPGPSRGQMARFRASSKLLGICESFGITPDTAAEHFNFVFEMPKELVRLTRPERLMGNSSSAMKAQQRVAALNAFFSAHQLKGAQHAGWVRIFHRGDAPGFNFDYGGRLYSQSPAQSLNYQHMSSEKRLELLIDDEPVAEVDISASYLTIYAAAHGFPLDPSSVYDVLGSGDYERAVAKHWFVASFGNSNLVSRWSQDQKTDFAKKHEAYGWRLNAKTQSAADVRTRVLEQYPTLKSWGQTSDPALPSSFGDLMFRESEAIISAMECLAQEHDIPAAPVHDSLIVPASKLDIASRVLREQFKSVVGVMPMVKVKRGKEP
jgi:hypothetical protein